MKRGWQWPVLVTLALGFTVGVNFVMLYAAKSDPNGTVVEPDYYRKAVEWDRTMARRAASAALGWTARASFSAVTPPSANATDAAALANEAPVTRALRVELRDASGVAIVDADVSAMLIHNREASTPESLTLAPADSGYAATARAALPGQWEVRVVARRGAERFETSLRVEAP